jgi:hypothetical protein
VRASVSARLGGPMLPCSVESEIHSAEAAPGLEYGEMPDAVQALVE